MHRPECGGGKGKVKAVGSSPPRARGCDSWLPHQQREGGRHARLTQCPRHKSRTTFRTTLTSTSRLVWDFLDCSVKGPLPLETSVSKPGRLGQLVTLF